MSVFNNFRAGNLKQGQSLGMIQSAINLGVTNTSSAPVVSDVDTTGANMIIVTSNSNGATNPGDNRFLYMTPSSLVGNLVYVIFRSAGIPPAAPGDDTSFTLMINSTLADFIVMTNYNDMALLLSDGKNWQVMYERVAGAIQ